MDKKLGTHFFQICLPEWINISWPCNSLQVEDFIFLKYRTGKKLAAAVKDQSVPWTGETIKTLVNYGSKFYVQVNKVSIFYFSVISNQYCRKVVCMHSSKLKSG